MKIKYSKSFSIAGVLVLSALMVAPSQAEDPAVPVTPVATTSVMPSGTIHVLSRVLNDNQGLKTADQFVFSVKHWGTDVAGSPFSMAGGVGVTMNLEPGSYVVSTPIIEGYNGVWFGEGITNGFIDLQAGQSITIARISDDVGAAVAVAVVPEVPATEDGGMLPSTSSPWFSALAAGLLVSAAGAFGLRKSVKLN